ncbi:UvrD-helicase domain-containing protein [Egicoccus halophilus]|uniref:RecBCD enzyme subunit RecB n=1 Tax=Egicoccus halophilus TaxID=1670830 RepID=A0A8J3A8K6_9ACTN|nr:UvrD-helicase domain-containing protein [Egicoccus halophilus]GGI06987.1 RecBCD enzyme subunit RecB [Egicoccus halophilus]
MTAHTTPHTAPEAARFELTGDLPRGRTILEASAGTGKTFAIAGLVARYVVEDGVPLPQLLVVTFTRAATAELRERVRERLVTTAEQLTRRLAGEPVPGGDEVLALLCDPAVGQEELRLRLDRASTAVADFDAATISTIHGFCQQVLRTLGFRVDADPDATVLQDQSELVATVVDDLLVQLATRHGLAAVRRKDLIDVAEKLVNNPDARIVPAVDTDADVADLDGDAEVRAWLAHRLRSGLARRKRDQRQLSYDDLLTQLRDALVDPDNGRAAAAALRERYRIALIDEFQDTDPVQWDILSRAFADPQATLVLIGDPKQAIYSFRGADIHAYLDAVDTADVRATLTTNWRSDAPLLQALDTLLDGATFGDPQIAYRQVEAAPGHRGPRITGGRAPLRLRVLPHGNGLQSWRGCVNAPAARDHIARDLAAQTVELLQSDTAVLCGGDDRRPLHAGDVAVLVRTNAEAVQVHRALRDVDVPAIINGVGSVFDTSAAMEWQRLLDALEQPANGSRARAVALTSWLGWTGEQLATADDDTFADLHDQLHRWAEVLRERGVASLVRTISDDTDLSARLLGVTGGERHLTDLDHLGQLLHRAAVEEQLGTAALTSWLTRAIAQVDDDQVPAEERARRLESDARAVQILTVHRSKGLEYPVVFAPYLWSPGLLNPPVPTFTTDGRRTLDVGGKREDDWDDHRALARQEIAGEGLRLLYVALTRAEHELVVWWAPCQDSHKAGLGRVLFARDGQGRLDTTTTAPRVPDDATAKHHLDALEAAAGGMLSVEHTPRWPAKDRWEAPAFGETALEAAVFDRHLDRAWYRTSYSAITARAHHRPVVGSEVTEDVVDDETLEPAPLGVTGERATDTSSAPETAMPTLFDAVAAASGSAPVPLADMPGGTDVGTFTHVVLEHVDFAADDLRHEVARVTAEAKQRLRTDVGDVDVFVDGLVAAIDTPLGPLAGGQALRDLGTADRLNELDFELPLDPQLSGGVTVGRIAQLLDDTLPADDPLSDYGRELAAAGLDGDLRGFLAGSIDLVLRVPDGDGGQRFLVADHKTNRLGTSGQPLVADDYRHDALVDAMVRGHYPLQALLYQVALHRYLRWRVTDYRPEQHLGGALYLFVRGMTGPDTPVVDGCPHGVFAWQPPAALIEAVSDLFDGGAA